MCILVSQYIAKTKIPRTMSIIRKEMHPLLTEAFLKILHSKKIFTVVDFLQEDPEKLSQTTSLEFKDLSTLRQNFITKYAAFPLDALEAYNDVVANSAVMSTGIPRLDAVLDGGLMTGELVEVCGFSGSGKTQLCLTIAANVALFLKQRVYYIDCKNDFSGTRMQSIIEAHGIKDEDLGLAMERVQVFRPASASQLLSSLPHLHREIQLQRDASTITRVLIVDSLPSLFYAFMGDSSPLNAFGLLHTLGVALKQLACELHVAVLLVNLATLWRDDEDEASAATSEGGDWRPGFGKPWLSVPSSRLCLARKEDDLEVKVMKSSRLPGNRACSLKLSRKGVE